MEISQKIKSLRKALGLNQAEFAKPLKLKGGQISAVETGRNQLSESAIELIFANYPVSRDWWASGDGEMLVKSGASHQTSPVDGEVVIPERKIVINHARYSSVIVDIDMMMSSIRWAAEVSVTDIDKVALKIYNKRMKEKLGDQYEPIEIKELPSPITRTGTNG